MDMTVRVDKANGLGTSEVMGKDPVLKFFLSGLRIKKCNKDSIAAGTPVKGLS
jgi:hypothetical protein